MDFGNDVCFGLLKEFQQLSSGESWAEGERKKWIAEYERCHEQLVAVQNWAAELSVAKEFFEGQLKTLKGPPQNSAVETGLQAATTPTPPAIVPLGPVPDVDEETARRQRDERLKLEAEVARFFDRTEPPRSGSRK